MTAYLAKMLKPRAMSPGPAAVFRLLGPTAWPLSEDLSEPFIPFMGLEPLASPFVSSMVASARPRMGEGFGTRVSAVVRRRDGFAAIGPGVQT